MYSMSRNCGHQILLEMAQKCWEAVVLPHFWTPISANLCFSRCLYGACILIRLSALGKGGEYLVLQGLCSISKNGFKKKLPEKLSQVILSHSKGQVPKKGRRHPIGCRSSRCFFWGWSVRKNDSFLLLIGVSPLQNQAETLL